MTFTFEWDASKALANIRKHGVDFEEAATVFADTLSVTVPDPDHGDLEERWVTIGASSRQRLLVVVHADERDRIRIISARAANRRERRSYQEG